MTSNKELFLTFIGKGGIVAHRVYTWVRLTDGISLHQQSGRVFVKANPEKGGFPSELLLVTAIFF